MSESKHTPGEWFDDPSLGLVYSRPDPQAAIAKAEGRSTTPDEEWGAAGKTLRYDQETRDLVNLAHKRVADAINSVLQVCDGLDQTLQVSLMAAASAVGCATGTISAKYGCDRREAHEQLFILLRTPEEGVSADMARSYPSKAGES